MSLKRLKLIKQDNYLSWSKRGVVEYSDIEVDALIIEKETKSAEVMARKAHLQGRAIGRKAKAVMTCVADSMDLAALVMSVGKRIKALAMEKAYTLVDLVPVKYHITNVSNEYCVAMLPVKYNF